ncbi:hypothetical protein KOR34_24320 [Posidoniimonas corsicana]|uniref:Uncharacterized protein n=1 Tax=Posidoniimonas corsicana TaxID=1938618 RepID=A0A5C5VHQ5_9BACT|nr:HNH endonuclease [Posidoniimonas corsicana]TWT37480.1 hypothetical protein KOR34_24320 [Posidoniimonas corsicana]
MAQAPQKRCPRCRRLHRDACPTCKPKRHQQHDANRPSAYQRGYGRAWQRASKAHLEENPLCVECEKRGRITAATCVDHSIPHRGDMELFWRQELWQSMCAACHSRKTAQGL